MVFIRTVILYLIVMIGIRFLGKRQIGELSATEFVLAILISEVGAIPMQSTEIPLMYGIIPIVVLISAEIFITTISMYSSKFRNYATGRPVVVIERGKILQKEMKILRMTIDDLLEEVRQKDISHISDVYYAIVETNGKLTVFPKDQNNLTSNLYGYDIPLIKDGKISQKGLKDSGKNVEFVKKKLEDNKINKVEDVFLMTIDDRDNIYLVLKSD